MSMATNVGVSYFHKKNFSVVLLLSSYFPGKHEQLQYVDFISFQFTRIFLLREVPPQVDYVPVALFLANIFTYIQSYKYHGRTVINIKRNSDVPMMSSYIVNATSPMIVIIY